MSQLSTTSTPHTRLFILGGKGISEEEFRETFGSYGTIKDVWVVKDKVTNEDRGKNINLFLIDNVIALAT